MSTVFRARAVPQEVCDNFINALNPLANPQQDGDSPVKIVVDAPLEKTRLRMMDGLKKFIAPDNHAAVQIGCPRNTMESKKW